MAAPQSADHKGLHRRGFERVGADWDCVASGASDYRLKRTEKKGKRRKEKEGSCSTDQQGRMH
eukprot:1137049-Pelagomonas_calceolata.AAC.2